MNLILIKNSQTMCFKGLRSVQASEVQGVTPHLLAIFFFPLSILAMQRFYETLHILGANVAACFCTCKPAGISALCLVG